MLTNNIDTSRCSHVEVEFSAELMLESFVYFSVSWFMEALDALIEVFLIDLAFFQLLVQLIPLTFKSW